MTERRRQWLEKYGLLTAVATVVLVALTVLVQLAVISRWTGAIEESAKATCKRVDVLEAFKESASERFVTRPEHRDIQQKVDIQREQINRGVDEVKQLILRLGEKMDKHVDSTTKTRGDGR